MMYYLACRSEAYGDAVVGHVPLAVAISREAAVDEAVKSVVETARRFPSVKAKLLEYRYASLTDPELATVIRRALESEGTYQIRAFRWDVDEIGGPVPPRHAWVAIVRGESDREDPDFERMEATVMSCKGSALTFCTTHAANTLRSRSYAPTSAELEALRDNLETNGSAVIAVDDGSCLHYGVHETILPDARLLTEGDSNE